MEALCRRSTPSPVKAPLRQELAVDPEPWLAQSEGSALSGDAVVLDWFRIGGAVQQLDSGRSHQY